MFVCTCVFFMFLLHYVNIITFFNLIFLCFIFDKRLSFSVLINFDY